MQNKIWISLVIGVALAITATFFTLKISHEPVQKVGQLPIEAKNDLTDNDLAEIIPAQPPLIPRPEIPVANEDDENSSNSGKPASVDIEEYVEPLDENYAIFFDLRQLLQNSASGATKAVGVSNLFWYSVKHKRTPDHIELQKRLFAFMDHCTQKPRGAARFNDELMPSIMCDWISGLLKTQALIDLVLSFNQEAQEFFETEEEKILVLAILDLLRPDVLASLQKPQAKAIRLFEDCCRKYPNYVFILSNWDNESAALIKAEFPQIFSKIEPSHVLLSGELGQIKPSRNLYRWIAKKFNLNPQKCILIDECRDSTANAKAEGWHTILYVDPTQTAKKLKEIIS